MEFENTSEEGEEEELKFQANSRNVQGLEEQDKNIQNVPSRVIAGEQDTVRQEGQSVVNQRRTLTTQRLNLRDRSSIKPPPRFEVNVAEHILKTFKKTKSGSDGDKWSRAVAEELEAHQKNGTWILVPRRGIKTPIDSKYVFKILYDTTRNICRYKARLCARGFCQREGVDYSETFSPVVRYDSLRVFLTMVTQRDLEMSQFDDKTAFLHGDLDEEIFMEVPEGLDVDGDKSDVVYLLQKSLYGLKQAPRCWNDKFTHFLAQFGFKQCNSDPCIFLGQVENSVVYLALFIDDGLIASENKTVLETILDKLSDEFEITIGNGRSFVGVQIERDKANKTMFIHQEAYALQILDRFKMSEAKPVSVPADVHVCLKPAEDTNICLAVPFREAVGSLMFLAVMTHPELAYAVNNVSKYLANPDESHWQAIKRIFKYLKGTTRFGITYRAGGSESQLIGFADADYAGDIETRRSREEELPDTLFVSHMVYVYVVALFRTHIL